MVDVKLFPGAAGCGAVPLPHHYGGRRHQLPSVGPGNILGEILKANVVPTGTS